MVQYCCRWIYTAAGDAAGLCRRLNRLAELGWELEADGDGKSWFGRFHRTARTELRYDAATAPIFRDKAELERQVEERRRNGWEPVGTLNGIDIYVSRPCAEPQPMPIGRKRAALLRGLLLFAAVMMFYIFGNAAAGDEIWYLSNMGAVFVICRMVLPVVETGTVLWLALLLMGRDRKIPAIGTALLSLGKVSVELMAGAAVTALMLDRLRAALAVPLLLLLLAAAVLTAVRRFGNVTKLPKRLCAGALLILLWAGLVLHSFVPAGETQTAAGTSLSRSIPGVVSAEELSLPVTELKWAEYTADGSLLVRRGSYTERWEEGWYICEIYHCSLPQLAQRVETDCTRDNPGAMVQRDGTTVRVFRDSMGTDWEAVILPDEE